IRSEEDSVLKHVVQLEVRHDLGFIETISGLPHLLGVVLPIPRLEFESSALRVDQLLHVRRFGTRSCCRSRCEIRQQLDRVLGSLRALGLESVRGPTRISEQLRLLRAQLRYA